MRVDPYPAQSPFALPDAARSALEERVERAAAVARHRRGQVLASVTVPVSAELDASAVVLAARLDADRFFCLEQPDRDGFALAALGAAATVEARGGNRFADALRACRHLADGALIDDPADDPGRPSGSGPVWVGGFAFADEGGRSPEWSSLAPATLVMPEVAIARQSGEARLTLTAAVGADTSPDAVMERLDRRLSSLQPARIPLLDPDPLARAQVASAAPPEHFEEAVARATERIAAGELEKIVLAREVRVHAPAKIDPAPVFDALRGNFPACYCFLVGTPEAAFLGASPELMVRREGARAQSVALAGTTRRSADPAVDALLGEQLKASAKNREEHAIVARRIERTLEPVSVWVAPAEEPGIARVQNVQHLATPIRAQLRQPLACLELAGLLHPTPAVGGEPRDAALPLIPALEGLDRGWYAGPIGWTDLNEDGEFCVGIRSALIRGDVAHLYAGNGIVRDSNPAEELAETEVKLEALLPLFA